MELEMEMELENYVQTCIIIIYYYVDVVIFIYASLVPGIVATDAQLQNNKGVWSAAQSLQPAGLPNSVNIM